MTPHETRTRARDLLLQIAQGDHAARVPLADLCEERVDVAIDYFLAWMYTYHVPKQPGGIRWVEFARERGSRFEKILRNHMYLDRHPDRGDVIEGVYTECYVELETSLIWKSATYRKPALNFARGSVFLLPDAFLEPVDSGGALSEDELERAAVRIKGDDWYRERRLAMPWKVKA